MYNRDLEKLMLDCHVLKVKDKCKEVAERLVEKENVYAVARKINVQWDKQRNLMKNIEDADELKKWREEVFVLPVTMNVASGSGWPKKRLSDNPEAKTENKILDPIVQQIEDAAREQHIDPQLLLNKLVQRSQSKWGSEKQTTKDVPVEDTCTLIYNMKLSM